ncbi:5-formyltetrahydrofolate cyclo-ligase-related [Holotrichia oblita]|uniref:5-formyltetrahydrofolate cyclo-ligase-related n=1 Tax=Holotrichia oblita TaxID=644536 RepID=A0ACB9T5P1_HOLOL|nr:5-formyltetrahydrofolate cyclo-ligase-related [Holotrichia oblita]
MEILQKRGMAWREVEIAAKERLGKIHLQKKIELSYILKNEEDLFMVTDLLLGGDLRYHIAQEIHFSEDNVKLLVCEIAHALDYLKSRNIIHRDIKPDNILLDEGGHAHLTDFNIAILLENTHLATSMSGTKPYIAPEIFDCAVDLCVGYSYAVDWWSLGVVAFEMLRGCRPFDIHSNTTIQEVRILFHLGVEYPTCFSDSIIDLLSKLLCISPGARVSSIQELKKIKCLHRFDMDMVLQKKYKPPFCPPDGNSPIDPHQNLQHSSMIIPEFKIYNRYQELERRERERKELAWERELQIAMDLSDQATQKEESSTSHQIPTCQSCPKLGKGTGGDSPQKLRKMISYDSCSAVSKLAGKSEKCKSRRSSNEHVSTGKNLSVASEVNSSKSEAIGKELDTDAVRKKLQNIEFIDRTPSPSQELEEPIYRIKLEDDCTMSQTETSENQNHSDSSVTKPDEKENEVSKLQFRKKVWEYLEKNKLTNFPRPVYWRIPNFKGSEQAAAKLLELDEFKNVKYIEVNPDKPQEAARILVLENQKNLCVPVPRLKDGLLKYITIPEGATKNDIRNARSCLKEGYRIGKGRGYADLEFALLLEMGAVSDKTIVVTTVHDSQVFDTLPHEIFKDYDVPVDYILTPTQIIKIEKRLPRPTGIIWNILSQRRLNLMPVLKALKDIHDGKGKDTTLKDTDTDVEANEPRRRFPNRIKRLRRRRPRTDTKNSESQGEEASNNENVPQQRNYRRRKFFHRRKVARQQEKPSENGDTSVGENGQNAPKPPPPPRRNNRFPPFRRNLRQIDFSLMVSNIEKNVRVRDLKNALIERGIKPNVITWRGYKGICYLHYAKSNAKSVKPEKSPIVVDNVIEILQNLKISPDSETNLSVKIMEPVSRIETVNVTTV